MSEELTFWMGKTPAVLPADRKYARNHMWAQQQPGGAWRFGFTTYAIRLMKDVYFLSWAVDASDTVRLMQEIGHIETSKAESDLFAPLAGTLTRFNEALLNDPSAINVDGHGAGWLFEIESADAGPLMDAAGYHAFLTANWDNTQRMLKGKINTDEE
jgi:glycine cleavage system H protein